MLAPVPVAAQPWTKIWSHGINFNMNYGLVVAGGTALLWVVTRPLLVW
jgi:hypothetical protein